MAEPRPWLRILRSGDTSLDLTDSYSALKWATAAVGGFASCSFMVAGDVRRRLVMASVVRIGLESEILFEGQIEDLSLKLTDDGLVTEVQAFGLRRRLEQTSVKRIYVKRDLNWTVARVVNGGSLYPGSGTTISNQDSINDQKWVAGAFDPADQSKIGLRMLQSDSGGQFLGGAGLIHGRVAELIISGVTLTAILADLTIAGDEPTKWQGCIGSSADSGSTWSLTNTAVGPLTTSAVSHTCVANADRIRIGVRNAATLSPFESGDNVDYTNVRVLGAIATEDTSGALYGGTILRDLIAQVPDLQIGSIDSGNAFGIQQLDRSNRDSALSVVEEVATYYDANQWGVWESDTPGVGRFDWEPANLDEPHWLVTLADLTELNITSSVDSLVRTVYLSYIDAISLLGKEVSSTSTDQRNPFVKKSQTKDAAITIPFLMTAGSGGTAQRLADVLARLQGNYPPISGTISLPSSSLIRRPSGTEMPALTLRAGENIVIRDLPKSDVFLPGRDGETMFHVSSCEVDLAEGKVTCEVDAADRRQETLMARLTAATRSVTG